ncbi:MAG TPA: GlxA family transcriptional regulator [Rariglobus sp.]|nr:GlxA family transcriptional regulator [Rariglobus sp.]
MSYKQLFRPSDEIAKKSGPRELAMVVHPGFQVLSLAVTTVFEMANETAGEEAYHVTLFSESGGLVRSSLGFSIQTERLPKRIKKVDTIIAAGNNDFKPASEPLVRFLRTNAGAVRRMAATCTGALFLAQAGLLDSRRATTHWFYADRLREKYPAVTIDEDRIFIEDGPIWTSAGMTSAIDMAIAMVEQDLGAGIAKIVAKKMVVYHRRTGGQSQHSALLDLAPKSDRIQKALTYARANLKKITSVESLAEVATLSLRQFNRLFRVETGTSPASALERLRVEEARLMMESGNHSLDEIAEETGFGERERMRRAFLRAFGQSPQAIRRVTRTQVVAI